MKMNGLLYIILFIPCSICGIVGFFGSFISIPLFKLFNPNYKKPNDKAWVDVAPITNKLFSVFGWYINSLFDFFLKRIERKTIENKLGLCTKKHTHDCVFEKDNICYLNGKCDLKTPQNMRHSVNYIGETYEDLSNLRNDKKRFTKEGFFKYASDNKNKYSLIETNQDLLVSTWYSDLLINDYQKTLK